MNRLNVRPPDKQSSNQVWDFGYCVGLSCKEAYSSYNGNVRYITGTVYVGETYQTKSSYPSTLFILRVCDENTVEAIDQNKRKTRASPEFLLNPAYCERLS